MKFVFNSNSVFLCLLIVAINFSLPTVAQEKSDLQKDRTANMKILGRSMYQLKTASDVISMKDPAATIATTAKKLLNMWPEGSGGSATRAKTIIWAEMSKFNTKFLDMENATNKLVSATNGTDLRAAKAVFGEVGRTCKACHKVFRGPKK